MGQGVVVHALHALQQRLSAFQDSVEKRKFYSLTKFIYHIVASAPCDFPSPLGRAHTAVKKILLIIREYFESYLDSLNLPFILGKLLMLY